MYDNLKSLGITNPDEIDRYSLRQEANNDILKIYFQKDKGEFFAKSVKFKYPRQRKTVVADGVGQGYKEVQEISPNLRYVIDELDQICQRDRTEIDLKRKILDDLRHLESVVTNKISEIEADLENLPVSDSVPGGAPPDRATNIICRLRHASSRPGKANRLPAFLSRLPIVAHPAAGLYRAAADRQSCRDPDRSAPRYGSTDTPGYCDE